VLALIASAGAIELAGSSVTLDDAGLPDLVSALTAGSPVTRDRRRHPPGYSLPIA